MLARAAVDGIGIAEVIAQRDLELSHTCAGQPGEPFPQGLHDLGADRAVHAFVVVPAVDIAAVPPPVVADDLLDGLLPDGEDVEPEQHGPEAVLLADVIGAGAEALLAAERDAPGIEQIAEELPARRRLVARDVEGLGDTVDGLARRHRARDPLEPVPVARHEFGIGRDDGQAVARGHEEVLAEDHVAIAVAIRGCAEVEGVAAVHEFDEVLGIGQVRVRVAAAEIGKRRRVDDRAGHGAETVLDDLPGIGPRDRVHGVEAAVEQATLEQAADCREVEQGLHEFGIVGDRVDDVDEHRPEPGAAVRVDRNSGIGLEGPVAADLEAATVDLVRERLGRWTAVGHVELDAEIAVGAARVMAGRQNDAAVAGVLADQARGGRCRQ